MPFDAASLLIDQFRMGWKRLRIHGLTFEGLEGSDGCLRAIRALTDLGDLRAWLPLEELANQLDRDARDRPMVTPYREIRAALGEALERLAGPTRPTRTSDTSNFQIQERP